MVFVDCSFDKEKVKKECYKLVGISNLGKHSLMGYMNNPKYDKSQRDGEFTLMELTFIHQIANCLATNRVQAKTLLDSLFEKNNSCLHQANYDCFSSSFLFSVEELKAADYNMWHFFVFCKYYANGVEDGTMPNFRLPNYVDLVRIICNFLDLTMHPDLHNIMAYGHEDSPIVMAVVSWLLGNSTDGYHDSDWLNAMERLFLMEVLHDSWYLKKIRSLMQPVARKMGVIMRVH